VAWLADAGLAWWQMLPVGPVGYGNSPYSAQSTFAGNPLLVSLERLARDGLLLESELAPPACARPNRVDYGGVSAFRHAALARAFERFRTRPEARRAMGEFVERNASWLEDFALFRAIKSAHGERAWITWEPDLRDRKPRAMARARKALADDIARAQFAEFAFDAQWTELRTACSERGVRLIGDVPIFVAHDSADVWQHRELFHLDASGQPTVRARRRAARLFQRDGPALGKSVVPLAPHQEDGLRVVDRAARRGARAVRRRPSGSLHRVRALLGNSRE
jgi:4-alpha-glucanotransferase